MREPEPRSSGVPATAGTVQVRVRYGECDPMGVAHHAAYAPWFELARTELLRDSGVSYADLEASGVFLVVTRLEIRYRRPIRYDDVIEVRTRVVGVSRTRLEHEYELWIVERVRSGKAEEVPEFAAAVASTTLACVGPDGRVRELPAWMRPG